MAKDNIVAVKDSSKGSNKEEKQIGITAKKDSDFSEWFTQLIQKADLIDYSPVSGCYVLKPTAMAVWKKIQKFFNEKIEKSGVKEAYFPLFIPESLFKKEAEHVEGFTPEVAWVTHSGNTKLDERLAVRPTSETIMYDSYSRWIRSWRDLPLRINQWCNVVRWEFKNPMPFLRSREFLWQEGHTAFATKQEAEKEVLEILEYYRQIFEEVYAVPVLKGIKSEKEKFAGALYTTSVECFLPVGKAIQGATSHCLGQNFAKAFNIQFLDENSEKKYVWQNSWGITTRSIGIMLITHSDDKGIVFPPRIAPLQIMIVPIGKGNDLVKVKDTAEKLKTALSKNFTAEIDNREMSPGWRFNDSELKGIPLRIEIGPKDIAEKKAVLVRRDSGKKESVALENIPKKAAEMLDQMQKDLFNKAKKFITDNIVEVKDMDSFVKAINSKKLVLAAFCNDPACEDCIKEKTAGAKSINIPFDQPKSVGNCVQCNKKAKVVAYFAKSY